MRDKRVTKRDRRDKCDKRDSVTPLFNGHEHKKNS